MSLDSFEDQINACENYIHATNPESVTISQNDRDLILHKLVYDYRSSQAPSNNIQAYEPSIEQKHETHTKPKQNSTNMKTNEKQSFFCNVEDVAYTAYMIDTELNNNNRDSIEQESDKKSVNDDDSSFNSGHTSSYYSSYSDYSSSTIDSLPAHYPHIQRKNSGSYYDEMKHDLRHLKHKQRMSIQQRPKTQQNSYLQQKDKSHIRETRKPAVAKMIENEDNELTFQPKINRYAFQKCMDPNVQRVEFFPYYPLHVHIHSYLI